MKVFVTRKIMESGKKLLNDAGIEVTEWTAERDLTQEELIASCKEHDGLLSIGSNKLDAHFLQSCSHLKVIALHSVGYDHVDTETAKQLRIPVGNTPGVLTDATADLAFLLLLATSRKAFYQHKKILNGDWGFSNPSDTTDLGIELRGKTLGIFGLGSIGSELARRCKYAFGMQIIYTNRSSNLPAEKELDAQKVSFEELLAQSDAISVHANLTPETREQFNAAAFENMKETAIFGNAARGGIHNEKDLTIALKNGTIWGAGLDVTNPEPMDPGNELLNMPNVCVLPHIGSATIETRTAMLRLAAANVIAGLKGEQLPNWVNPF